MSPRKRKLITCIFCGDENVESSGEDVFPKWIARKLAHVAQERLPEHAPDYIEHSYSNIEDFSDDMKSGQPGEKAIDETRRGGKPLIDKLPDVCTTCNTGWMSHLEGAVNPIIEGFIFGREKTLDPYDEFVIATWITKTCLTYDAGHSDPWIPAEMGSRRFYESGYPLFGVHAMIGHDPNHTPEGALVHRRGPHHRIHRQNGETFEAAYFGFQFDHLLVAAVINCFDSIAVTQRMEGASLPIESSTYVEVWPHLKRVRWPSDEARVLREPREPASVTEEPVAEPPDGTKIEPA
jgi:hypothetical protein